MSERLMYKLIVPFLFVLSFSACQTHLPIVSEDMSCEYDIEEIELTDIDYLLYANKMIDAMIKNTRVKKELKNKRMNLEVLPVVNVTSEKIDLKSVYLAIYNRLLRSGYFILHSNSSVADYQLSAVFDSVSQSFEPCGQQYKRLSLQIEKLQNSEILWSEEKKFN